MLIDSEISGEDVGSAMKAGNRSLAQLNEDLHHVEEHLARKGLSASEREQLQAEAEQIRQSIRANSDTHAEQQEALASTPMTFTYHSEHSRPPLREAVKNAGDAFVTGMSILLTIVITLLPWLLLLGFGWALFRMVKSRWTASRQDSAPQPQDAP
jgi:ATP-dependent Zn protease